MPDSNTPTALNEIDQAPRLNRIPPWLTLLVLAPILGELVSGHQTPLEFINPFNLLVLSLPYGCGALVCRELTVRWKGGGVCLLLLGIAYGVFEEGIVVYSLFDPHWSELGPLAQYGFYAGVNWIWALGTVQFHALVSIGSSVVIAHIIHSDRRNKPWLAKKGLAICFASLSVWIIVMGLIMSLDMKRQLPPLHLYLLAWGTLLTLVWLARRSARLRLTAPYRVAPKPWYFFLLGSMNMTVVFVGVFSTPELGFPPPIVTMPLLLLLDSVSLALVWRWSGHGRGWDDRHRLALVGGLLVFFVYFSFDKDLETWQGSSIVGVLTILGLWRLARLVNQRHRVTTGVVPKS